MGLSENWVYTPKSDLYTLPVSYSTSFFGYTTFSHTPTYSKPKNDDVISGLSGRESARYFIFWSVAEVRSCSINNMEMEMDQNLFCHILLGDEHLVALFLCSPGIHFVHEYSRHVNRINPKRLYIGGGAPCKYQILWRAHIYIYIYMYMYTYIHACIHTYIHT